MEVALLKLIVPTGQALHPDVLAPPDVHVQGQHESVRSALSPLQSKLLVLTSIVHSFFETKASVRYF